MDVWGLVSNELKPDWLILEACFSWNKLVTTQMISINISYNAVSISFGISSLSIWGFNVFFSVEFPIANLSCIDKQILILILKALIRLIRMYRVDRIAWIDQDLPNWLNWSDWSNWSNWLEMFRTDRNDQIDRID